MRIQWCYSLCEYSGITACANTVALQLLILVYYNFLFCTTTSPPYFPPTINPSYHYHTSLLSPPYLPPITTIHVPPFVSIPHLLSLLCPLQMLLNLHKKTWLDGLQLLDFKDHCSNNEKTLKVCSYWNLCHFFPPLYEISK